MHKDYPGTQPERCHKDHRGQHHELHAYNTSFLRQQHTQHSASSCEAEIQDWTLNSPFNPKHSTVLWLLTPKKTVKQCPNHPSTALQVSHSFLPNSHIPFTTLCLFLNCPRYTDSFALFPLGVSFSARLLSPLLPSCFKLSFPNLSTLLLGGFLPFFQAYTKTPIFHPVIVLFRSLSRQAELFLSAVHMHYRKKKPSLSPTETKKEQGNGNTGWKPQEKKEVAMRESMPGAYL